jgi:hypothetical protein
MDDPGCWQWVTREEIIQSIFQFALLLSVAGSLAIARTALLHTTKRSRN